MRSRPTGYAATYAWCDNQPCSSADFVSVPIESLAFLLRELASVHADIDHTNQFCLDVMRERDEARECREALMAESMQTQRRVIDWQSQSNEGMRLRCGELTSLEIYTIRAVLSAILPANTPAHEPRKESNENTRNK